MSTKGKSDALPAAQTANRPEAAGDVGAPGGRYYLTITDPENSLAKGSLTISIGVKANSLDSLTASDDDGNTYEVSFRVRKKRVKPARRAAPSDGAADSGAVVAGSTGDTAAVALTDTNPAETAHAAGGTNPGPPSPGNPGPHPPGGGSGDDDDEDEDEDDDECQCCSVVGGRLMCQTCPCP